MMRWVERFRRESGGAAAAEMALMLPLLVILLFGAVEAGHYLWSEHKVIKGVRDGARYAGRQLFDSVDCAAGQFKSTSIIETGLTVEDAVKNVTRTGTVDASGVPVVSGWTDNATEVDVTIVCDSTTKTGLYADLDDGAPVVTVSATVDYPSLFGPIIPALASTELNAKAQAAVMGL